MTTNESIGPLESLVSVRHCGVEGARRELAEAEARRDQNDADLSQLAATLASHDSAVRSALQGDGEMNDLTVYRGLSKGLAQAMRARRDRLTRAEAACAVAQAKLRMALAQWRAAQGATSRRQASLDAVATRRDRLEADDRAVLGWAGLNVGEA